MGHTRLHRLPKTRPWRAVVGFIMNEGDAGQVASAVWKASKTAFTHVQKDPGFSEAVYLLSQLAVAASKPNPRAYLSQLGINIPERPSAADVAMALAAAYDAAMDGTRRKSDFGEMSQLALVSSVTKYLTQSPADMFPDVRRDVGGALHALRNKDHFSELTRGFFADFTDRFTNYFLSKALADHVGEGRRFATTTQMSNFETAMRLHCHEASAIVQTFSADWYANQHYSKKTDISRSTASKFGWFALEKMKAELSLRAAG